MAVSVTRRWSPEDTDRQLDSRTAVAEFDVTGVNSSTEAETATDATTGLTIPVQNDAFVDRAGTEVPLLKAESIRSTTRGFQLFRVTVTYSVPEDGEQHFGGTIEDDPLNAPTQYVWELGVVQTPFNVDVVTGLAILNGAGDPPEQDPTRDERVAYLNVIRNEATFDASLHLTYANHVNSNEPFFGADAGQARCVGIVSSKVTTADAAYWEVRYRFEFKQDRYGIAGSAHKYVAINRGLRFIHNVSGKPVVVVEGDQFNDEVDLGIRESLPQASTPLLLNSNGTLRDPASEPDYIVANRYETADFGALNLE